MIRLLALDLDGTLMDDDMVVRSDRVRRAIGAAQARGVVVTLATGRMLDSTVLFARDLGIAAPLICYQGGLIQAPDASEPVYRATMAPALAHEVLDWRAAGGHHLALYAGRDVFLDERRHPDPFYRQMLGDRLIWVDALSSVPEQHEPVKFIVFVAPEDALEVRQGLQQRFGDRLEITQSHALIVEGNPLGVSKGDALQRLAAHLDVPRSQVMAVGDQDNDASMIAWAGLGVAMGNASAATKAAADWVAPSVADEGAAVAIERFILGGEGG